ncbi:MAG: efflux RND transporter periplasmic adaptor subunit [Alphaproteobacteria bacterium]|nr:efflux RND transporter periplasmic adaptor subunit [Alphaproteobacteria bacterium]
MNFDPAAPALSRTQQLRILGLSVGAIIALALLVTGVRALLNRPEAPPPPLPAGQLQLTAQQMSGLTLDVVRFDDGLERTLASGQIAIDETRSTPVFLPYSGQILNVAVQSGDHVRAGDALLSIRTSDVGDARNALMSAEAQRASAASQLRVAEANFNRADEIYKTAGGALKDLQQARADLINAQSALRMADSAAAAARGKLTVFGASPAGAGGAADAVLRAPIAGTIVTRSVAAGQFVTGGSGQPAFVISDLSRVWLVAQVPESEASRVKLGDHLSVTTTAFPGRVFDAVVDNVAAQIDPVTHRLVVRATIANPDGALKPQMFADFTIRNPIAKPTTSGPKILSVPSEAVIHEGDSARVWVYLGHGRVLARTVQAGESHDGRITLFSGVKPGDKIVTRGALFVNEAGAL